MRDNKGDKFMKDVNEDVSKPGVTTKPKVASKRRKKTDEPKSEGIPGFLSAENMALINHALQHGNYREVPKEPQTYEEFLHWLKNP